MHETGRQNIWARGALLAALGLGLTACEQFEDLNLPFRGNGESETQGNGLAPAEGGSGESRDVEAPDVFQKTETGLWDGRPSLGGIWVAHPDVGDPERVIIRNEDNGRFVTGALFRRERENPGPPFQASSDAAEELGMLAGAPARLTVTALRREEVETSPDFAAPLDDDTAIGLAPPAEIAASPLDGDVASVADDLAGPAEIAAPAGAAAAIGAAATESALSPVVTVAPTTPPSDSTLAAIDAISAAAIAAEAEAGFTASLPPLPDAGLAPPPVSEVPLNALGPISDPVPLPLPPSVGATSSLDKPFIQVGIFSVEATANDAAETLRGDGVSASVVQQGGDGTNFWRVLVGPAPNAQDRTAILAKVQALGFNDAYFVAN